MTLKIRFIKNNSELKKAFKIREIVFVKEQKVSTEEEYDGLDKEAKQVVILTNNKIIGCARLRFIDKKAKVERVALLKKYRKNGFGGKLLEFIIEYCKKRKVKEIYGHAQYHLKDFYRKYGFKERGKPFYEANIKHIEMFMNPN